MSIQTVSSTTSFEIGFSQLSKNPQYKIISLIFAAALGALMACYLIYSRCFKNRNIISNPLQNTQETIRNLMKGGPNQNWDEAGKKLAAAVNTYPDDLFLLSRHADFLISKLNYKDAKPVLERALKIDPNDVMSIENYATVLEFEGDSVGAQKMFERAQKIDPNSIKSLYNINKLEDTISG